jgi:hypothetical protein
MLKRMQAQRDDCCGFRLAEYPEHAAFIAKGIRFAVIQIVGVE